MGCEVGQHVGIDSAEGVLKDCGDGSGGGSIGDEESFLSLILIFIHLFSLYNQNYVYLSFSKILQVSSKRILLSSLV